MQLRTVAALIVFCLPAGVVAHRQVALQARSFPSSVDFETRLLEEPDKPTLERLDEQRYHAALHEPRELLPPSSASTVRRSSPRLVTNTSNRVQWAGTLGTDAKRLPTNTGWYLPGYSTVEGARMALRQGFSLCNKRNPFFRTVGLAMMAGGITGLAFTYFAEDPWVRDPATLSEWWRGLAKWFPSALGVALVVLALAYLLRPPAGWVPPT